MREESIAEEDEEEYSSDDFEQVTPLRQQLTQTTADPVNDIVRRALAGVDVAQVDDDDEYEPVLDMVAMRRAVQAQSKAIAPVIELPNGVASPLPEAPAVVDDPHVPEQQVDLMADARGGHIDSRLAMLLTRDTGKQAFTREADHWVEADGDFGAEAGDVAGGSRSSALAVMQQKEVARFKDLGATRGQFRLPETTWPSEVNDLRAKMGEHRRSEATEVISHADEWQKRFEAENDQCHELALELQSLKAQLTEPETDSNVLRCN